MEDVKGVVQQFASHTTGGLVLLQVGTDIEFQLVADLQHLGLGHHTQDGISC